MRNKQPTKDEVNEILRKENEMLNQKLEMLARYVETEEGLFTFPDGDSIPTSLISKTEDEQLVEERKNVYGDPFLSHEAIGYAWEGVIRNRYHLLASFLNNEMNDTRLFPADLVAEFLAAFKIVRLARPVYKKDSGDDARIYVSFSQEFREKE